MNKKASYTVEASMTLPLFVFLCACVLVFFRVLTVEWGVSVALNETARETAVAFADKSGEAGLTEKAVMLTRGRIAANKTPLSAVYLGIAGMNFSESRVDEKDVYLAVSYRIPLPVSVFGIRDVSVSQCARAHRWVGFDPSEGVGGESGGDTVYITQTGKAYHKDRGCSYLNPSIRPVALSSVSHERNSSGHKYYECPLCKGKAAMVYITTYGENYHTDIRCSGLKRTISATTEKDAKKKGYHACSKCSRD